MDEERNTPPEKLLLTAEECAHTLSVSRRTIYVLRKEGHLRGVHIGRAWRVSVDEVRAYINKLQDHRESPERDVALRPMSRARWNVYG